jgi:hypothetical protein
VFQMWGWVGQQQGPRGPGVRSEAPTCQTVCLLSCHCAKELGSEPKAGWGSTMVPSRPCSSPSHLGKWMGGLA